MDVGDGDWEEGEGEGWERGAGEEVYMALEDGECEEAKPPKVASGESEFCQHEKL